MRLERTPAYANLKTPTLIAVGLFSILGCTVRPSPHRWLLYIPIFFLTLFFVFYVRTDDLSGDYNHSMVLGTNIFAMSDFLLLTDVQNELWRKGQARGSIVGTSFFQRLKWGLDLHISKRGVGWQHDSTADISPSSSPSPAKGSAKKSTSYGGRVEFVLRQLVALGQRALAFVIANLLMEMNSSFRADGPPFDKQVWWLRPTVLAQPFVVQTALDSIYILCSIVTVLFGVSSADAWPPLFGSWLEAYSVHNVWRHVWHQMMRRFLTVHMKFVANLIKPRNKTIRRLIQLYTAFFVSSIIHYVGDIVLLNNWSGGAAKFFLLQGIAITFENLVAVLFQKSGIRIAHVVVKVIGYGWVFLWFLVTFPVWIQPIVRSGLIDDGWHHPLISGIAEQLKVQLGVETR